MKSIALLLCTASLATAASDNHSIQLSPIGTYASGIFEKSAAEIVAHDPAMQRLFVVNALSGSVDVLDINDPTAPFKVGTIQIGTNFVGPLGTNANSVAVRDGIVAVAVEAVDKTANGKVVFYDASLNFLNAVEVGSLPDMLIFSPNGRWLLVANEGEPNTTYTNDPQGTVSIIDMAQGAVALQQSDVRTVSFAPFNTSLLDASIRVFGPGSTVAQDFEPEYIAISQDSKTAYVALQENNALALIDIDSAVATEVVGLGFKDHSLAGNGFDASDRGGINIRPWPVLGMYQPDAIDAYQYRGDTFLVLANEGDARDYDAFKEEITVGSTNVILDPVKFPNATFLKNATNLGRLTISKVNSDTDGDGDYDRIFAFGARSFSIRDAQGSLVWDSGDELEQITAAFLGTNGFNANHTSNAFDNRSDNKGPEPEAITVGKAFGSTYAFVGMERVSGIVAYDISDPYSPEFVAYVDNRDFTKDPRTPAAGDLGPEGMIYIKAEDSPTEMPLLVVANEVSGSTTIYAISKVKK